MIDQMAGLVLAKLGGFAGTDLAVGRRAVAELRTATNLADQAGEQHRTTTHDDTLRSRHRSPSARYGVHRKRLVCPPRPGDPLAMGTK